MLALLLVALWILAGCGGIGRQVAGKVLDAQGGPIAGAQVRAGRQSVATAADGAFALGIGPRRDALVVTAAGYVEATVTLAPTAAPPAPLEIVLQARTLQGMVLGATGEQPVAGAQLTLGAFAAQTDAAGAFSLPAQVEAPLMVSGTGCLSRTIESAAWLKAFDARGQIAQPLVVRLDPRQVTGRVVSRGDGAPLAGARVTVGSQEVVADAEGAFALSGVEPGAALRAQAVDHQALAAIYEGQTVLELRLDPWQVAMLVREQIHAQPLAGVRISGAGEEVITDAAGLATLSAPPGQTVTLTLQGYCTETLTIQPQPDQTVVMRPERLVTRVSDSTTKTPVANALVQVFRKGVPEPELVRTNETGDVELTDSVGVERVIVKAPRYLRATMPITRSGVVDVSLTPFEARGIYIPFAQLSLPNRIRELLDLAHTAGLNTVVLDVKSDSSYIAWPSQVKAAQDAGAYLPNMMTLQEFLGLCKERNLYVIARMVIFKDDLLATAHPEWAVSRANGAVYKDPNNRWMDPFRKEVQAYNIALAVEVAQMGFDEVQFDYVRFPSDGGTKGLVYQHESTFDSRIATISGFLEEAQAALLATPAYFSVDIFGSRVVASDPHCSLEGLCDDGIGQWLEEMAPHVDYLSPMVYPDVFIPGNLGLAQPVRSPYETVYLSMKKALARTTTPIRPWISHYSPTWRGVTYGVPDYVAQRKAADDAGTDGWLFWNARGNYYPESLGPDAYSLIPNLPSPPK